MTNLKPCPFCGYDDMEDCVQAVPSVWMFTCRKCKMQMIMSADSAGAARKKYNTRAPQWQPIETAPTNQIVFIYAQKWGVPVMAKRFRDEWMVHVVSRVHRINIFEPFEYVPSHWMPLPEPPRESEAAND